LGSQQHLGQRWLPRHLHLVLTHFFGGKPHAPHSQLCCLAWDFRLPLEGTWPNDAHATPAECSATDTAVQKLDFLPEPANP
jgi:hypothetical protein